MTKRLKSKHKVDRRLKANIWGRPKSPFNSRNYPPGQHGKNKNDGGIIREVERVGDDENERSDRGIGEDRGSRRNRSEDAERGRKYERNCE